MSQFPPASEPPVRLGPGLDPAAFGTIFAGRGRVHIPGILSHGAAERAWQCMATETPWRIVLNDERGGHTLQVASLDQLTTADAAQVTAVVNRRATEYFQFVYQSFPLYECHRDGVLPQLYLMRVYEFLASPEFLGFARAVTGIPTLRHVDAQATCYRSGHFLTVHDDDVPEKKRRVAYVLNLTPRWNPDWGGLLVFRDRDGGASEAWVPTFNALNLFRVPQLHSVSYVTPFAAEGRYAISGWLRDD